MTSEQLIAKLEQAPQPFSDVIALIDAEYNFVPTSFKNGDQQNQAGTNNGSCKIFAFGRLHQLTEQATLHAFGDFYTQDVLGNPDGSDHANIRNFMRSGWAGVSFEGDALTLK